jgi:hypothetical protein
VAPRFWYIDARFRCDGCGSSFIWFALEQKMWFETLGFHVEARPKHCPACSRARRDALQLRREYDALVGAAKSAGTREQMSQIVRIVDELEASMGTLPDRMRETRARFRRALSSEGP